MTSAHMSLWYPGPLGGTKEANWGSSDADVDQELNFPLGCCDSEGQATLPSPGVCRGHLDLYDSQDAQVIWHSGQEAYFQLSDYTYSPDAPGNTHYGGSCQVGFSVDRGVTWRAAASFNGNCPHRGMDGSPKAQTFNFKIPIGMPEGKALFAWLWLNREHESFMNCAVVQISGAINSTAIQDGPPKSSASPESENHGGDKLAFRDPFGRCAEKYGRAPGLGIRDSEGEKAPGVDCSLETLDRIQRPSIHSRRPGWVGKSMEACAWDDAAPMAVSYFTADAKCAPNAKLNGPESDTFEIGWEAPCGVVEDDGEFPIKTLECDVSV